MGIEMAIIGAGVSLMAADAAAQGTTDVGKYNKSIADRNADVADNRAQQRVFQAGQEVVAFREDFRALNDASAQAMRKNGVVATSGTALDVLMANAEEAEKDVQMIKYNAAAEASDLREKGVNERLRGELALYSAKNEARAIRMKGISDAFKTGYNIYNS